MTDMTVKRDPAVLALEIRTLQSQAEAILTSYVIEIGRRLCEAKAVLEHGQWGPWLKTEVQFSQSTANNYMRIYEQFGSEQVSLFGDAKSQSVGNLPYTKALRLLALPEDEVEGFVRDNDVESMSVRELEKAIRERDEARAALEREKLSGNKLAAELEEVRKSSQDALEDLKVEVTEAEDAAEKAEEEADRLRAELKELQARPIEVAVQDPPPELLEQIRAEEAARAGKAAEALQKKLEAAEARAEKEAKKARKLKEKADKAGEEAKAAMQKDMEAATAAQREAEAAKADAEARAKALEDKLKTANGDAAAFQVYFQQAQESCNRMLGLIQKSEPAQQAKYKAALRAMLDSLGGML